MSQITLEERKGGGASRGGHSNCTPPSRRTLRRRGLNKTKAMSFFFNADKNGPPVTGGAAGIAPVGLFNQSPGMPFCGCCEPVAWWCPEEAAAASLEGPRRDAPKMMNTFTKSKAGRGW